MRVKCVSAQKQVVLAYFIWAGDHENKFPMAVSVANGGVREMLETSAVTIYRLMSNELNDPKVLICPEDKLHNPAAGFATLGESNLSYFVGLDAEKPSTSRVLSGDRTVEVNGRLAGTGLVRIESTSIVRWPKQIHYKLGIVGMADGSVQRTDSKQLKELLQSTGLATNRLLIP